jgi:di/tricarboxylate transporter
VTWKIPVTAVIIMSILVSLFFNLYSPFFIFIVASVLFILLDIIKVEDLQNGFASEAMITNALLFPIVKPISSSSFIKVYCKYVFGRNGNWPRFSLLKIMLTVAILSLFLNNTPIVALFIPIIKDWCKTNNLSASKFLIPLSYATIVGKI